MIGENRQAVTDEPVVHVEYNAEQSFKHIRKLLLTMGIYSRIIELNVMNLESETYRFSRFVKFLNA